MATKKTTAKTPARKRGGPKKTAQTKKTTPSSKPSAEPSAKPTASAARGGRAGERLAEYKQKRDFTRTREPEGQSATRKTSAKQHALRFVIQKHAASQLHFDLRLELDGVMKSWAVPKGPSIDPTVKRLAMQVEDHPIEYNTFEGTIPEGEYGGGTVMLWDTGTYLPDTAAIAATRKSRTTKSETVPDIESSHSLEDIARDAYERGDFKVIFSGKRMRGTYVLVRTRGFGGRSSSKPSWLLIKHRDEFAIESPSSDLVEQYTTSVVTDRTMEEIRDEA